MYLPDEKEQNVEVARVQYLAANLYSRCLLHDLLVGLLGVL